MKKFAFILSLITVLVLTGCDSKVVTLSDQEIGNDIFYYKSNIKPFNGTCNIMYKNSENIKIRVSFKEGKMHGKVMYYYKNGELKTKGAYKDGMCSGKWESWYENGEKYFNIYYSNDSLNGEYVEFYDNGSVKEEGNYNMNKRTGKWKFFDSNGTRIDNKLACCN
jgi:antitoxin component YwqK of YwqJK toxin-antitoxin module